MSAAVRRRWGLAGFHSCPTSAYAILHPRVDVIEKHR